MQNDTITHKKIWDYLEKIIVYIDEENLNNLEKVIYLMENDYMPLQKFGTSSLEFELIKKKNYYISDDKTKFKYSNNYNQTQKQVLDMYNNSKNHMQAEELICIISVLSMIIDHQASIKLENNQDKYILKVLTNEKKMIKG